ncbi:uncharacterized protein LOC122789702 [Protopterus annectens]|uniref:uncharacterized protein LOC122789702 n=1 Tax=Protopterus annectens TaxID=7888 RepID=UPI001CFA49E6|nr:uncharacterized protein LOC122789702 [Protopterus annectens]
MFSAKTFLAIFTVFASSLPYGSSANDTNCTGINDFQKCSSVSKDFCPSGISCLCKNQNPFCSCPNYKDGWIDYWYMGSRCEQLWSTIDLILIATLPAIALTMLVAVIMQIVNCCSQPKAPKTTQSQKQTSNQRRKESEKNEQDNYAFMSEMSQKVPNVSQHATQVAVEPSYPYTPRLQSPNLKQPNFQPEQFAAHHNSYSPMPMQQYSNMGPSYNQPSSPVSHYSPHRQSQKPRYERDYDEDDYTDRISAVPMKPIPKSAVPVFPQIDRRQSQYGASNNFQEERPYEIGRARIQQHY